jgi:phosphate butyryltransferase
MSYKNFEELKKNIIKSGTKTKCAVVAAADPHTLEAVMRAYNDGLIMPVLIGNQPIIQEFLDDNNLSDPEIKIYDVRDHEAAMNLAIEMVHAGDVQCVMKGLLQTSQFMGALLKKDNKLRTGKMVSMLSFRELPNYHKIIAFTDTGICPHPTLDQKKEIINNAVSVMNDMGIENPKVGVLAAVEVANHKMPESTDGEELKQMNIDGEIPDCTVEGPISLDLALSKESAEIKGYESQVAGDVDLLVFPDLASANITTKMIAHITNTPAGVLILGTKVPAIVCSRAATIETKYLCITLAAAKKNKVNVG